MEKWNSLVTFITSAIAALTALYKMCFKREHNRVEKYYENILCPYLIAYKQNKNVYAVKFLKKKIQYSEEYVPKYILYLIEHQKKEELHKVILYDYYDLYKNEDNTRAQFMDGMIKIGTYIEFFISLICMFYCFFFLTNAVTVLLGQQPLFANLLKEEGILFSKWMISLAYVFGAAIMGGLAALVGMLSKVISFDRYTLNKRKIKQHIALKIKAYDRKNEKWFL